MQNINEVPTQRVSIVHQKRVGEDSKNKYGSAPEQGLFREQKVRENQELKVFQRLKQPISLAQRNPPRGRLPRSKHQCTTITSTLSLKVRFSSAVPLFKNPSSAGLPASLHYRRGWHFPNSVLDQAWPYQHAVTSDFRDP